MQPNLYSIILRENDLDETEEEWLNHDEEEVVEEENSEGGE